MWHIAVEFCPASLGDVRHWEQDLVWLAKQGYAVEDLRCTGPATLQRHGYPRHGRGQGQGRPSAMCALQTPLGLTSGDGGSAADTAEFDAALLAAVKMFLGGALGRLGAEGSSDFWLELRDKGASSNAT